MTLIGDAIRQRRSIRNFTPKPVPAEIIRRILEAATYAPSAHKAQPWRFIILTDASAKLGLAQAMARAWLQDLTRDGVAEEARMALPKASVERFTRAPVLAVACLTMEDMIQFPDEKRQRSERDLAVQSLAAAIQNLLLAAYAEGLGACWYCAPAFCQNAVRKTLKIPESVEPQAIITIGYPAEAPETPPRKALQSIAYLGAWGEKL